MGNSHSHKNASRGRGASSIQEDIPDPAPRPQSASILKLFEKLELTADEGNTHPGELSRKTFENAFHGPLHKFGKLMYKQMLSQSGQVDRDRDRITREAFVAAGNEIVCKFNVADQRKYYFKLFAGGKDYLTKEDALQMVHVSYMLTVSVSKITYNHDDRDIKVFEGMVTSMFGVEEQLRCAELEAWLLVHCPNMFSGVHSWVCIVLHGSNLPSEMEARTVPQLEDFICGEHCLCLGMAWALASVLPKCFTHSAQSGNAPAAGPSNQKNPLLTQYHHFLTMHCLPRVQSWNLLYSSERDGLSKNRFVHHVMSYHGPILILLSFEGRNQYCLALDTPLHEGIQKFGGKDCRLIQLLPVYRVIQTGARMVMWNSMSRSVVKGLQIGQDGKVQVLRLNEDFDSIYHYDVPCALHRMEVWGCGGDDAKHAQMKQKQWEAKDTERQRTRKLRLEGDWRENPDKQILEWGGVRTGSSYVDSR